MTSLNWVWETQNLFAFARELHNPKDQYVRAKLQTFLRKQNARALRAELLSEDQLGAEHREGFRVHVTVDGLEDQYFEFLRKQDGTYAFRSTISNPKLTFNAVFDFEKMSRGTKNLLDHDFDQAINRLLAS